MLRNDDPPEPAPLLDAAPWGAHAEDRVLTLGDGHALVSLGYSNPTPWNSHRELPEEALGGAYRRPLRPAVDEPRRAVLNAHVPPYMSGLDERRARCRACGCRRRPDRSKMGAVGSTAVRDAIERHQPLASLDGHVHESAGFRRIGRRLAVNPGSDYGTGALNGALLVLEGDRVRAHQLGARMSGGGPPLLAAVDVGTTGARAVAIDLAAPLVAEARRPDRTRAPHPGWAEQEAARVGRARRLGADGAVRPPPAPGAGGRIGALEQYDE